MKIDRIIAEIPFRIGASHPKGLLRYLCTRPPGILSRLRRSAFGRTVRLAASHSSFYRQRFLHYGIDVEKAAGPEDLGSFYLHSEDIRKEPEALLCGRPEVVIESSGTTGHVARIFMSQREIDYNARQGVLLKAIYGVSDDDRVLSTFDYGFCLDGLLAQRMLPYWKTFGVCVGRVDPAEIFHRLPSYRFNIVMSGTPWLSRFTEVAEAEGRPYPLKRLVGGGGGGAAAGGGGNITIEAIKNFSISTDYIKENVSLGASKTRTFSIVNTGNVALHFNLNVLTVDEFVSLSESSFSLEPGQKKILEINIIGKKLGSYIGEIGITGDGIKRSIDVIIEVESQQVLFDVKIDVPSAYKEVEPGSDLKAQITLFNVGAVRQVNVALTYLIKDKLGNVIYESSETLPVEKQTSFVKVFTIPKDAQPGDYLVIVELRHENSFAVSSELFKVVSKKAVIAKITISNITLISALATLAALMLLFTYLLIPKMKVFERRKIQECYKILNDAKDAVKSRNILKARQLYMEARQLYFGLKNKYKKEIYDKLIDLYNKLK